MKSFAGSATTLSAIAIYEEWKDLHEEHEVLLDEIGDRLDELT